MKKLFKRIEHIFSLNSLSSTFRRFSLMHCLFLIFISIQGLFINTLLFRSTGDITTVAIYNVFSWAFVAIFMTIAVFVVKRTSLKFTFIFSIIMYILSYIFLFVFMKNIGDHLFTIVLFSSLGGGFYWIGFSFAVTKYNDKRSKHIALAWLGSLATVVNLIMPALSGIIISAVGGINGYYVVFGIALLFAILTVITAFSMPKTILYNKKTMFKYAIKSCFKNKLLFYIMSGEFTRGIREGAFMFLLNILLFELIKSEAVIGLNTLLCSSIVLVAQWSSARISNRFKYSKIINFSVTSLTIATLLIMFNYSPFTIILLSAINGFFSVFLSNPTLGIFYNGVMKADTENNISFEIFSLREYLLAIGRTLGIVIVFAMPKTPFGYAIGLIILTLSQLLMSYFMSKADDIIHLEE